MRQHLRSLPYLLCKNLKIKNFTGANRENGGRLGSLFYISKAQN